MRAWHLLGLLGLLGPAWGCEPELRDALYACPDQQCPGGFDCIDGICRSTPDGLPPAGSAPGTGGADDGPPGPGAMPPPPGPMGDGSGDGDVGDGDGDGDGDMPPDPGEPPAGKPLAVCASDAECESGSCVTGPDASASVRFCSTECSEAAPCGEDFGPNATCVLGQCLRGCTGDADCPEGSGCFEAAEGMTAVPPACFEASDPTLHGTVTCHPMRDPCADPTFCLFQHDYDPDSGLCSLRCNAGAGCPGGGRCVEVLDGVRHCLLECEGAGDCVDPNLTCGSFGPGNDVCVPAGWVGATPPLPRPTMPTGPMPPGP